MAQKGKSFLMQCQERDNRIEEMLLAGVTNHWHIAAAFGIERKAVTKAVAKIYKNWAANNPELEELRFLRQKQFENVYRLALKGYEASTRRMVGMEKVSQECEYCYGLGLIEGQPKEYTECAMCGGTGNVEEEVPKYVEVQGDSTFLRLAKDTLAELTKLEGLGPATTSTRSIITRSRMIGGVIEQQVEEIYSEAPPDTLVRALCVMSELQESHDRKKSALKGSVRVIDNPEDRPGEKE